jgi:glycosyltransferase involved in cell wall biosynthesis
MSDRPVISFVLVTYNQERFIREAVEGALSQTYSPLEIVLSDDCSTDQTFKIMKEMVSAYRGPHKIILNCNLRNLKTGDHFNRCMELATGELRVLGAGDDISMPGRVQRIYEVWLDSGCCAAAVMSNAIPIDEAGRDLAPAFYIQESGDRPGLVLLRRYDDRARIGLLETERKGLHYSDGLLGATTAIHRRVYAEYGPLTHHLYGEDEGFSIRANFLGGMAYTDDLLVRYRRDCGQRIPDDWPKEKRDLYQYLLDDHIFRQTRSHLHDLETSLRKGRVTKSRARQLAARFEWENQKCHIRMLQYQKCWGWLTVRALGYLCLRHNRRRLAGWLLYQFCPKVHQTYMRMGHAGTRENAGGGSTGFDTAYLDCFARP